MPQPLGTRYIDNQLIVKEDKVIEDSIVPKDVLAARILKQIGNSISNMIQLEDDVCSNYVDKKLPILDCKVWVEKYEESVKIRHEFYKKPIATRATLNRKTAYPTTHVRSILVEEIRE